MAAQALKAKGQTAEAESEMKRALELNPDDELVQMYSASPTKE